VLLPVRDGMPWLPAAVASILQQTCRDFELVVLEDGSTDDTPRFLDTLQDPRVRLVFCGGVGIAHALNLGLATARADIVARQDADDESLPERLARQLSVLDSNPAIDLVATTAEYIDASGSVVDDAWVQTVRRQQDVAQTPDEIADLMVLTCCVTHGSIAARARTLRAAGGYRPDMVPAEDYDLWLRLLPRHRFLKLPDRLYRHRLHDAQSGARRRPQQIHQSIVAKLLYLRRAIPGLPSRPRLAIEGGTRGEAFYRAAAPEAGFDVVSGAGWDVLAFTDFAHLPSHAVGNFVLRAEWRTQPWSKKRPA
jgi:glycosyltransferase involved in cell wall biosynthesis